MSDSLLVLAFWMGIVSACSLPLGTLTTLVWRPDDRSVGILMAFGGGALLAALTIDLVGSALARGEFAWLAMGCILGGVLFVVLDNTVNNRGGFLRKSSTVVHYLRRKHRQRFKHALEDLERIALFDDLPQEHIEDLAAAVVQETFAKGATIYSAGDPSDFLYVVDGGEVSVTDPRNQGRVAAVHQERGTPGQHAFLTGSPHTHHAFASEESRIWMLPREAFHKVLGESAALAAATLEFVNGESVADYLEDRQGLAPEAIAGWRESAASGLGAGVIPNAVTIDRRRDEFVRISDGIRRLPVFRGLSPADLRAVADRLFCVRYERGDTIFRHGELPERLYSGANLREVQERLGSDHLALALFPLRGSLAGDREEASRAADVPVLSRPCRIEQRIESRRQRRDEEDRHDEHPGYPSAPLWLRADAGADCDRGWSWHGHGLACSRPGVRAVGGHSGEPSPGVRRNSRSLRQIRTIRTYSGSRRYTIRNGGWISSLRNRCPNSGTILPISGCVRSAPNRSKISSINRSPTSGTSCSAYHSLSRSRSDTADSTKRIVTRGMGYSRPSRFFASVRETSLPASRSASPVTTARMKTRSSSAAS